MRYLMKNFASLKQNFSRARIALFLDYDGTLTPIVQRPHLARLKKAQREILKRAASTPDLDVILVSGRALEDIKKRVCIPGLTYVGNHGLEWEGRNARFVHPKALAFKSWKSPLVKTLTRAFRGYKGVHIEDKGLTLSVHYRRLNPFKIPSARVVLFHHVADYLRQSKAIVTEGKKVLEIRPATDWDKGRAVRKLLDKLEKKTKKKILPVYFGDDRTDESAFKAVNGRGLSVLVSKKIVNTTAAKYQVKSVGEVYGFIDKLTGLKHG